MPNNTFTILPGQTYPLGATVRDGGVNFSLFSKNSDVVELLLFDKEDHSQPSHVIRLDPEVNKTFYYWHCFIPGLQEGQLYGYHVYGPFEPDRGLRFDGQKVLIDPYARALVTDTYDREKAKHPGNNCAFAPKSVVIDPHNYDWEGDKCLDNPFAKSVIYELHVGGFTKNPNSGLPAHERGTYRGLTKKIPYLKELGVTAVELLPVQQFDPNEAPEGLINYWGYAPMAFFAPHNGYGCTDDPVELVNEFRDMVKAFHKAGIEVILDVVFNHTAEGNEKGPTLSFKGLENLGYYILEKDKHYYKNYSGTGNTLNANHSVVRRMIRDCLRVWVAEMHIDGFRFDLASVLSRGEDGAPLENPPLLWSIESDPVLAPSKIIAEAWDLEQYQLGNFVGDKWAEWNGQYRDDVRQFLKGDEGMLGVITNRILGSPDLFKALKRRNPNRSINFVTCHDGFTLNDLVSYNHKHNEDNQEGNRDGTDANYSWNHGEEGPSQNPDVEALRIRQIKNFLTLLMISKGTPMLLMGDEVRRTQRGNNNAYCQDNELSWFDWSALEREKDLFEYVKKIIRFNLSTPYFQEGYFWNLKKQKDTTHIVWHGTRIGEPDLSHQSHSIAFSLTNHRYDDQLHVIINSFWEPLTFELPPLEMDGGNRWVQILNTALDHQEEEKVEGFEYTAQARSMIIFKGKQQWTEEKNKK
jgi:isoamylase